MMELPEEGWAVDKLIDTAKELHAVDNFSTGSYLSPINRTVPVIFVSRPILFLVWW